MAPNKFSKVLYLGVVDLNHGHRAALFCKVEFSKGELSISGVEGPSSNGNAKGSCGQIVMHPWTFIGYADGWNAELVATFRAVWEEWHLNHMRAGTLAQRACIAANHAQIEQRRHLASHYAICRAVLEQCGLLYDPSHGGYEYGSKWLKEDVPAWVLDFLDRLPVSPLTPAWV